MYLVVCMSAGLALAVLATLSDAAFWAGLTLSLVALGLYWAYLAPTRQLEPVPQTKMSFAALAAGLRTGAFLRALAWLVGLGLVAAIYLTAVKLVAKLFAVG